MNKKLYEKGQAMILSITMLGGVLVGISVIAGLLVIYQIRQVNDVENSARAFFAADAGLEWETYRIYVASTTAPTLSNGASFIPTSTIAGENIYIRAQGFSGDAVRALDSEFIAPIGITLFDTIDGNTQIVAGGTTALKWDSINAVYCTLTFDGTPYIVNPSNNNYPVDVSGLAVGDSKTYELTCTEGANTTAPSFVTLTIVEPI